MKSPIKKLYFKLHHDTSTKSYSVGVEIENEEVCRLTDFNHLANSIGLGDIGEKSVKSCSNIDAKQNSKTNISVNESPLALTSAECFQSKMTEYVFENSEQFKEKHSDYFVSLIGSCESTHVMKSLECQHCYRHPSRA